MKIALVFCGQGRNVEKSFYYIKNKILDLYDTDVYCHLWWDDDIMKNGYIGYGRNYSVPQNLPDVIQSLYHPKKFLINPQIKNFTEVTKIQFNCASLNVFMSQFIGIQRSFGLFDWSEYDFILRMRYDLQIINFPNLYELKKNFFYTGYENEQVYYNNPDFFSDLSYILPNDMKQFTQVVDNMVDFKMLNDCVPEHVMMETLKRLNFREKMIRLKSEVFYCDVIRD